MAKTLEEPKPGRPSSFTQEAADVICERIATSAFSLKNICATDEMLPDVSTVLRWLRTNEEFRTQYARAKEEQADMLIDDILDIADDGSNDLMTIVKGDESYEVENREVTARSKLRVDARKWIASKLKPKKYGDKIEFDGKVDTQNPQTSALLAALADKLNLNADSAAG